MFSALLNRFKLVYGVEEFSSAKVPSNLVSKCKVAQVLILVAVFHRYCD